MSDESDGDSDDAHAPAENPNGNGLYSIGLALGLKTLWQQHPTHLKRDHVKKRAKRGEVIEIEDVTGADVQYRLKMHILSGAGQHYENRMLESFERTLEDLGCSVDALVYDGLHVYVPWGMSEYQVRRKMIENCIRDTRNNPTVEGYNVQEPYFDLSPLDQGVFSTSLKNPFEFRVSSFEFFSLGFAGGCAEFSWSYFGFC